MTTATDDSRKMYIADNLGRRWSAKVTTIKKETAKTYVLANDSVVKKSNIDAYDFIGRYATLDRQKIIDKFEKELDNIANESIRVKEIIKGLKEHE